MWTLLVGIAIKILEFFLDREKADKELREAFIRFQKAIDAHRSLKVNESARGQRERLKDDAS